MLNSLYGRFGVSPYLDKHIIINSKDLVDLSEKENITNVLSLSQDKELVSYQSNLQIEIENNNTLCNIAIAAAVPLVLEYSGVNLKICLNIPYIIQILIVLILINLYLKNMLVMN